MNDRIDVTIQIGQYEIRPHPAPNNQVWIEVKRIDQVDDYGIGYGPETTIVVDELFKDESIWGSDLGLTLGDK